MIKYILLFYYLTTALLPRKVHKNGCPNCHNCHSRIFSPSATTFIPISTR